MTTFSTGGSAVTFTTSGSAVSFAVTDATNAFTTSAVLTPGAHASTHGAGGADPITTLGTVTTTLGTVTTLVANTATINAGTATGLALVTPTIGTATITGGTATSLNLVTPTIGTATITGGTATTLTAAGEIHTGQAIFAAGSAAGPSLSFTGDTNTGIYSPGADQVGIATAGTARVIVDSTGNMGLGTTAPTFEFHQVKETDRARMLIDGYAASANGNMIVHRRARGTLSSPGALSADDQIFLLAGRGHDGSAFNGNNRVAVVGLASEAHTSTAQGTYLTINTTPNGSTTLTERMKIDNAGLITGTGTSLGAWTAYTPTLGGFTPGSGTPTSGAWVRIGKIVHFRAIWTYGAGSAAASARPTLTLPSASQAVLAGDFTAYFFDTSAGAYYQAVPVQTSTTVVTIGVQGALGISDAASTTSPFTWATGDTITLTGTYEIA